MPPDSMTSSGAPVTISPPGITSQTTSAVRSASSRSCVETHDRERPARVSWRSSAHQLDARRHVEKRGRLVEQEQHRLLRQRARDHHALPFAVGQPAEVALREMTRADRVDRPVHHVAIAIGQPAQPA